MTKTLDGSVAVVTGGARGIGHACALRLASLGAKVAVIDRDLDAAAEYGEHVNGSVEEELQALAGEGMGVQAELGLPGAAEAAIASVVDRWNRLDILVCVAGGAVTPYDRSAASVIQDDDLSSLIEANMKTTVASCRAAVPFMRDSGGGAIVTFSSSAGLRVSAPSGHLAGYAMTKAAIQHYTRYLATEVGKWGIRANCVAPGRIRTARIVAQSVATGAITHAAVASVPLGRLGEPSDIADAVEYLTTPLSAWLSGQIIGVNGGELPH
jgi:3-oxoacyl-[acyl-carrier protein] reductase